MKKIYIKPDIESIAINAIWALCDGTIQNNGSQPDPDPDPSPWPGGAPGRRLF